MNPASYNSLTAWRRAARIALPIAIMVFIANSAWSVYTRQTTGRLVVSSFADNTVITITQDNREAKIIGRGTANIRLQPGQYKVAAMSAGVTSSTHVRIQQGQTTAAEIIKKTAPVVPSAASIDFSGFQALIDQGITIEQVVVLQKLFFRYKNTATTVTIDDSVTAGARTPDSGDPFTLNFTGTVDKAPYRAAIAYQKLEDLQLTVFDPATGAQLFQDGILEAEPPIHSEEIGDSQ